MKAKTLADLQMELTKMKREAGQDFLDTLLPYCEGYEDAIGDVMEIIERWLSNEG